MRAVGGWQRRGAPCSAWPVYHTVAQPAADTPQCCGGDAHRGDAVAAEQQRMRRMHMARATSIAASESRGPKVTTMPLLSQPCVRRYPQDGCNMVVDDSTAVHAPYPHAIAAGEAVVYGCAARLRRGALATWRQW